MDKIFTFFLPQFDLFFSFYKYLGLLATHLNYIEIILLTWVKVFSSFNYHCNPTTNIKISLYKKQAYTNYSKNILV